MSDDHRIYTCGFSIARASDPAYDTVLLVCKSRPAWQEGLWNGVGGSLDKGEKPRQCMEREFHEETGYRVEAREWHGFAHESGPGYEVFFYRHFSSGPLPLLRERNDVGEALAYFSVNNVPPAIGNLNWLIPMARDPRPTLIASIRTSDDIRQLATW